MWDRFREGETVWDRFREGETVWDRFREGETVLDRFREGGRVRRCDRIAQSVTGWSPIKMGGGGGSMFFANHTGHTCGRIQPLCQEGSNLGQCDCSAQVDC